MALNYIWLAFFIIAFIAGIVKLFTGDTEVFSALFNSTIDTAKTAVEISIGLIGVLTFWLGIMKVGEKGGVVNALAKIVAPFFKRLFPGVPENHPATGHMVMNLSANMLGLDNAATPMGLKAMESLQELNPEKETATNAQIMFLVLNTSGLTIIPISIMVYRAQLGAANPADIFIPILLATFFSTLAGILAVSFYQKINLLDRWIIGGIAGLSVIIGGIIYYFSTLTPDEINRVSSVSSNLILFSIIILFLVMAFVKKVNVYESFIEGAKEGFGVAIKIIPYLVAILVAIGVFRASGAMDGLIAAIAYPFKLMNINTDFIPSLPTALMKPLSGSGARGMMIDAMKTYGADSFTGRLVSTLQGATDTTFYILAVYFGAVNIKRIRHALPCGLIADGAGILAAIFIAYLFFK